VNPPAAPSAAASAAPPGSSEAQPAAPASASAAASAAAPSATPARIELKPTIATAFASDLAALGLDPAKLPPIEKLPPKALRGVMKLFAKSLGVKCGDCHQEGDYAAPTPRKKVAAKMWNEFVAKLAFDDGTPLFCDSCHQGRVKQLDRSDKKGVLSPWMDANFVKRLKRRDGKSHGCETCHGDDWDMTLVSNWSK
jgi:hypothetical protein